VSKGRLTIPGNDLDQLWLHFQHLLPAEVREVFTDKDPVLGVEVG
jgi:hypothetical protein